MINHSQDQMDIVTGISLGGDRIPVAELAKAFQRSSVLNNFNFTKPQIGVLNTGSIERIDSAITLSRGADTDEVAQRIKELTEAVVKCEDLGRDTKNEAIELADSLSTELVGSRQLATMTALAKAIKEKVGGVLALSNAADALWTAIESLFR